MKDHSEVFNSLSDQEKELELSNVITIMQQYNLKDGWIRYDEVDSKKGYRLNFYNSYVEFSAFITLEDLLKNQKK